jgi:hypothetical protein
MFDSVELREWNEYVRLLVGLLALINPLTILPSSAWCRAAPGRRSARSRWSRR